MAEQDATSGCSMTRNAWARMPSVPVCSNLQRWPTFPNGERRQTTHCVSTPSPIWPIIPMSIVSRPRKLRATSVRRRRTPTHDQRSSRKCSGTWLFAVVLPPLSRLPACARFPRTCRCLRRRRLPSLVRSPRPTCHPSSPSRFLLFRQSVVRPSPSDLDRRTLPVPGPPTSRSTGPPTSQPPRRPRSTPRTRWRPFPVPAEWFEQQSYYFFVHESVLLQYFANLLDPLLPSVYFSTL